MCFNLPILVRSLANALDVNNNHFHLKAHYSGSDWQINLIFTINGLFAIYPKEVFFQEVMMQT